MIALWLLTGCLVPVHRVNYDEGVTRTSSKTAEQLVGPVATAAEVSGDELQLVVELAYDCRQETWNDIRVRQVSETVDKRRFVSDWVWAAVATGLTTTAWSLADTETDLGALPFTVALITTLPTAIQLGTAIRTTARFERASYHTRTQVQGVGDWSRCRTAPFHGTARAEVQADREHFRLAPAPAEDDVIRHDALRVPADAWDAPKWTVKLTETSEETVTTGTGRRAQSVQRAVDAREGPEVSIAVTGDFREVQIKRETADRREADRRARERESPAARCLGGGVHGRSRWKACAELLQPAAVGAAKAAVALDRMAGGTGSAPPAERSSEPDNAGVSSKTTGSPEPRLGAGDRAEEGEVSGRPTATVPRSAFWVEGVVTYHDGGVCEGCPVSASPSAAGTVWTESNGHFRIDLLDERLKFLYIDGTTEWSGSLACYRGCTVNLERGPDE